MKSTVGRGSTPPCQEAGIDAGPVVRVRVL
jgi:hypothetical protein